MEIWCLSWAALLQPQFQSWFRTVLRLHGRVSTSGSRCLSAYDLHCRLPYQLTRGDIPLFVADLGSRFHCGTLSKGHGVSIKLMAWRCCSAAEPLPEYLQDLMSLCWEIFKFARELIMRYPETSRHEKPGARDRLLHIPCRDSW